MIDCGINIINYRDNKSDVCKKWYNSVDGRTINKYRRLLIKENKEIFDNFKLELLKKMNQILKENGFPTIE